MESGAFSAAFCALIHGGHRQMSAWGEIQGTAPSTVVLGRYYNLHITAGSQMKMARVAPPRKKHETETFRQRHFYST